MPELHTDGTHLISKTGHIHTPAICAISGTPISKSSKPRTLRLDHFNRRLFWPLPVLIYIIATIFLFKTIPNHHINIAIISIYIILTWAFLATVLYLSGKIGRQSISLELHLSRKTKFLLTLPIVISGAIFLTYVALQLTILKDTDTGETLKGFGILIVFIPQILQLQFSPLNKIKITKLQNNLLHISGLHPNLLKTLPTQSSPKSC